MDNRYIDYVKKIYKNLPEEVIEYFLPTSKNPLDEITKKTFIQNS